MLIVAGLDPSGGAGLVADVAVVVARGLHPVAVATALTVQDSSRCHAWESPTTELVAAQLRRLILDLPIAAVKIGMLGTAAMARVVAEELVALVRLGVPVVLDPVLRASVGEALLRDGDCAITAFAPLLPLVTLLTPNREEAERLSGHAVADEAGQTAAGEALRARGALAVLVKGGHLGGDTAIDLLVDEFGSLALRSPRLPGAAPHGTGCALATEVTCALALGNPLREAVAAGHARVHARIAAARALGKGRLFLGSALMDQVLGFKGTSR